MEYAVITFNSISDALTFEKVAFSEASFHFNLIPIPREISSSCGVVARLAVEDLKLAESLIEAKQLTVNECHILQEQGKRKLIRKKQEQ
ncbi:MAG: DUF3343 domain-containing protein [Clostridia bacterium]